jgi:hypothetical protein
MYPDLNDYLFIYLFIFTSLVQAQTMWALATSNGFFFFLFFGFTLLEYIYINKYISPRMVEKNPNPKFRTITFMTFTL